MHLFLKSAVLMPRKFLFQATFEWFSYVIRWCTKVTYSVINESIHSSLFPLKDNSLGINPLLTLMTE